MADEIGCSEQTIRNIFTVRAKQLEDEALRLRKEGLYETPEELAIDEVYPQHKGRECCVISAPLRKQVLDILPSNKKIKELFLWLLQLPNRRLVKLVTIDMCPKNRWVLKRLLPGAWIVVDMYHVHNQLNVALKKVLDVIRDSMTYSEHRERMRAERLLLTSYRKLSKKEKVNKHGVKQPSDKKLADISVPGMNSRIYIQHGKGRSPHAISTTAFATTSRGSIRGTSSTIPRPMTSGNSVQPSITACASRCRNNRTTRVSSALMVSKI
ncbi:MAG: transposase [Acidobacteria bacterium]|nr:transposase [Acidobacteriota bacterium]